jgi:hypothetical protein
MNQLVKCLTGDFSGCFKHWRADGVPQVGCLLLSGAHHGPGHTGSPEGSSYDSRLRASSSLVTVLYADVVIILRYRCNRILDHLYTADGSTRGVRGKALLEAFSFTGRPSRIHEPSFVHHQTTIYSAEAIRALRYRYYS